jgi:hypothetical protein
MQGGGVRPGLPDRFSCALKRPIPRAPALVSATNLNARNLLSQTLDLSWELDDAN